MLPIQVINPATGQMLKSYEPMTELQVAEKLSHAHHAQQAWQRHGFAERAKLMHQAAQVMRKHAKDYAVLITQEMGKPIKQSLAEIEKCAWNCEYYAEHAEAFLRPQIIKTEAQKSYVSYLPLGLVCAIMPWNFPFWQVIRFAAPALMAGNGAVLKHAANVPGCALAIERLFTEAGFPEHLFSTLLIEHKQIDAVLENPLVKAITLTGSTAAGQHVASKAGSLIKKTVLELGGSDAYIILADADLPKAAEICVASRLNNSGQSCIAAKRFVVVESVRKQFEELMVQQMQQAKMGDPENEINHVGPLARFDLRDNLHTQVQQSIVQGARCLLGGKIPELKGAFYPPTVLTEVKKGMPAYDEELFGPVAAIISVQDEHEAIKVANDSIYGLGSAIFTQNIAKGEQIAQQLEAGSCFINALVKSDPRLPFGGVKMSGYGRELSEVGIKEFVNIKTVLIG